MAKNGAKKLTVVSVRLEDDLVAAIKKTLQTRHRREPWKRQGFGSFIRESVHWYILHQDASDIGQ